MGTNRLISVGAASYYPASMVKNLVHWCQIFKVLQLQPQKRAKRSHLRVCGDSWSFNVRARQCTITPSLQDVEFLDHKMRDFMFPCCSVLKQEAFFIIEAD